MGTTGASRRSLLAWAWVVGALVTTVVATLAARTFYADTFFDLVSGRELAAHGFSRADPWTFLGHGHRWVDQQWLAHLAYWGAYRAWGFHAVALLSSLAIGVGIGVLAALTASRGAAPIRIGIWLGATVVVAMVNSFVRAQSFAYIAFAVAMALLVVDHDRRAAGRGTTGLRAGLLVTLLAWGNLHGSVVGFLPVVVASLAWQAWQLRATMRGAALVRQLGWAVGACVAPLLTPYGTGIFHYYHGVLDNPELRASISEWRPASIASPFQSIFFLLVLASVLVLALAWRRRVWPHPVLLLGTAWFAVAGLQAVRSQVWLAFFAAPFLVDLLTKLDAARAVGGAGPATQPVRASGSHPRTGLRRVGRAALVAVPLAALVVAVVVHAATPERHYYGRLPVALIDRAATLAGPDGRMCGDEDVSTATEFRHPGLRGRVAFDVRFELYSQAQLHGVFGVLVDRDPAVPTWVDGCEVVLAGTDSSHPEFVRTVRHLPGFHVVASDRRGVLAQRDD